MAKMTPSEVGIGGEYGGAVLMAVEYAPEGRRGFYGSWPQAGVPAGRVRETQEEAQVPFTELLRMQPKELLLGMGTRWIEGLVFNAYGVFTLTTSVAEEPEAVVEKS